MDSVPVIIADDHPLMRIGLRLVLNESGRYRILAECDSAADLLERLNAGELDDARLLVLDMKMPQSTSGSFGGTGVAIVPGQGQYVGLGLLKAVREARPDMQVLVLSEQRDPEVIATARQLGARGYIFKDDMAENVVESLDRIRTGEEAFSAEARVALAYKETANNAVALLTPRETQLLEMLSGGLRDREIAERLEITARTVAFHKSNLKEKLGAESTAEMISIYHSARQA